MFFISLALSIVLLSPPAIFMPALSPDAQGVAELVARCDAGDARACRFAAGAFRADVSIEADEWRALELFDIGCDRGDGPSCSEITRHYVRQREFEVAHWAARRACQQGQVPDCTALGDLAPSDPAVKLARMEEACGQKEDGACVALAHHLAYGWVGPPDTIRAIRLVESMCDEGSQDGCAALAWYMMYGVTKVPQPRRARELAQKGCDQGHQLSCVAFAACLTRGIGGPLDADRARRALEPHCTTHADWACRALWEFKLLGLGGPVQRDEALRLATERCQAGDGPSCSQAGWIFYGDGRDEEAYAFSRRGCLEGSSPSCVGAARLAWHERGDRASARRWFRHGCAHTRAKAANLTAVVYGMNEYAERIDEHQLRLRDAHCRAIRSPDACSDLARWWAAAGETERADSYEALAKEILDERCVRDPGSCRERSLLLGALDMSDETAE